jgi:fibronectin type 3 domain-containing protein
MDGRYSIKAKTGDDLVFSFVGMAETIKKSGATNTINVSMQSGESLSEVVVQTNFGYFLKIQGCYLLPFLLFRQTKLQDNLQH